MSKHNFLSTDQQGQHDLTSVRSLVKSVAPLARYLNTTGAAIYRWFKVDRIPAAQVIKVANFYDIELRELIHLTGSDKSRVSPYRIKPRSVLPVLLEVRAGTLTLAQAVEKTGQPEVSLKLVLIHWGDELKNLYDTLEALDRKEINLGEACQRLKVTKQTLHGLRRKYGYAPGALKRVRPEKTLGKRKEVLRAAALELIAGKGSAESIAAEYGVSSRNLFRFMAQFCPLSVSKLAAFPTTFRLAYADEIDKNLGKYVEKWLEIAEKANLYIKKQVKYPKTPGDWKGATLKRMLIGVLAGEASMEEIAASRGADPDILAGLFTSDLQALGLTYDEILGLPFNHQMALVEFLIWQSDRKRRLASD